MTDNTDIEDFVTRYVAVWNEPNPEARRAAVHALWSVDGVQSTEEKQFEGHRAIETRIAAAYDEFVARGGFVFRAAADAIGHHGLIRFTTYMVPAGGGEVAWVGAIVCELGANGLIRRDYQFSLPPATDVTVGQAPGTRTVVEEYLRRRNDGDERLVDLFAETVDWRVSWPTAEHDAVPWIRPASTRAEVAALFRTFQEHCDPDAGAVSIDQLLIDGADAVVVGTSSQLVKTTGRRFTMAFALQLTVENGLLSRHHMFEDSLAVAEAFGG